MTQSNKIYEVQANGVTLTMTPNYKEALEVFSNSTTTKSFLKFFSLNPNTGIKTQLVGA